MLVSGAGHNFAVFSVAWTLPRPGGPDNSTVKPDDMAHPKPWPQEEKVVNEKGENLHEDP